MCDIKEARRQAVKKIVDQKYGTAQCGMYRDFRELLDRDDIDAVLIATGPNWHATMSVYAARAGKDIYCEKPCTKNIAQSLALAETMQRTARGSFKPALSAHRRLRFRLPTGPHRKAWQTDQGLRIPWACRPCPAAGCRRNPAERRRD